MKGKLYIHFMVEFPGSLAPDQCKALEAVLPPKPVSKLTGMELDDVRRPLCMMSTTSRMSCVGSGLMLPRWHTRMMMRCLEELKEFSACNSKHNISSRDFLVIRAHEETCKVCCRFLDHYGFGVAGYRTKLIPPSKQGLYPFCCN
jgi:hypothetical protein